MLEALLYRDVLSISSRQDLAQTAFSSYVSLEGTSLLHFSNCSRNGLLGRVAGVAPLLGNCRASQISDIERECSHRPSPGFLALDLRIRTAKYDQDPLETTTHSTDPVRQIVEALQNTRGTN